MGEPALKYSEMNDVPGAETPTKAKVELVGNSGFKIQLERLRHGEMFDQSDDMVVAKGQGCFNNPNGPTC